MVTEMAKMLPIQGTATKANSKTRQLIDVEEEENYTFVNDPTTTYP
tara:strand:- start:153 stop:290 length:138 start_codon:yes stop_codon:yes gene_type:complete